MTNIFDYSDVRAFLAAYLANKQKRNPRYSLRAWSKHLGFNSPGYISQVLNGTRPLSPEASEKIASSLRLKSREREFFELLVLLDQANSPQQREVCLRLLVESAPDPTLADLSLDRLKLITEEHHLAILEMAQKGELEADLGDCRSLARRIGNGISAEQAAIAVARLERLDLLRRNERGEFITFLAVYADGGSSLGSEEGSAGAVADAQYYLGEELRIDDDGSQKRMYCLLVKREWAVVGKQIKVSILTSNFTQFKATTTVDLLPNERFQIKDSFGVFSASGYRTGVPFTANEVQYFTFAEFKPTRENFTGVQSFHSHGAHFVKIFTQGGSSRPTYTSRTQLLNIRQNEYERLLGTRSDIVNTWEKLKANSEQN